MLVRFRSKNVSLVVVLVFLSGIVARVIYIYFEIEYGRNMAIETCQTDSYFIQTMSKENLSKQTNPVTT